MAGLIRCVCGGRFPTVEEGEGGSARCPECGRAPAISQSGPGGLDSIMFPATGLATASLVLGLLSLGCGALAGLPAIVVGRLGLDEIRRSRGRIGGRGRALAGMALGVFGSTVVTGALLLPVVRMAREWERGKQCAENLGKIARGMHGYHDAYGRFPAAAITDAQGRPLLSWRVAILPFLGPDEAALFGEFHLKEPWDSPHNRPLLDRMPAIYACPDEAGGVPGTTNYQVEVGPGSLFTGKRKGLRIQDVIAGTSRTLMVSESDHPVPWTAPREIPDTAAEGEANPGSRHPGGYYTVMADGRVRYVYSVGAGP